MGTFLRHSVVSLWRISVASGGYTQTVCMYVCLVAWLSAVRRHMMELHSKLLQYCSGGQACELQSRKEVVLDKIMSKTISNQNQNRLFTDDLK